MVQKLKRIRLSNQLTLEELANRSELTKGFLSQLEGFNVTKCCHIRKYFLEALGTNLKDFSEDEDEQIVFSKDDFLKIYKMIIKFLILFQMLKKMKWNLF